jgi:hypothetical protein
MDNTEIYDSGHKSVTHTMVVPSRKGKPSHLHMSDAALRTGSNIIVSDTLNAHTIDVTLQRHPTVALGVDLFHAVDEKNEICIPLCTSANTTHHTIVDDKDKVMTSGDGDKVIHTIYHHVVSPGEGSVTLSTPITKPAEFDEKGMKILHKKLDPNWAGFTDAHVTAGAVVVTHKGVATHVNVAPYDTKTNMKSGVHHMLTNTDKKRNMLNGRYSVPKVDAQRKWKEPPMVGTLAAIQMTPADFIMTSNQIKTVLAPTTDFKDGLGVAITPLSGGVLTTGTHVELKIHRTPLSKAGYVQSKTDDETVEITREDMAKIKGNRLPQDATQTGLHGLGGESLRPFSFCQVSVLTPPQAWSQMPSPRKSSGSRSKSSRRRTLSSMPKPREIVAAVAPALYARLVRTMYPDDAAAPILMQLVASHDTTYITPAWLAYKTNIALDVCDAFLRNTEHFFVTVEDYGVPNGIIKTLAQRVCFIAEGKAVLYGIDTGVAASLCTPPSASPLADSHRVSRRTCAFYAWAERWLQDRRSPR